MHIYHSCFKFWRKLPEETKRRFCWIAVTKTVPSDYEEKVYRKLAPLGARFDRWIWPEFNEEGFFQEYSKLLDELDKEEVLEELKAMSEDEKDIVILNWEDMSKKSEGRIAYAWLLEMTEEEASKMDLEEVLKKESLGTDDRVFDI